MNMYIHFLVWLVAMETKNILLTFKCLYHVPSANMVEVGFMPYAAASHQGAIHMINCLCLILFKKLSVKNLFFCRW